MKKIILFLTLILSLRAIEFKETKFIEAFELETYRYGTVQYSTKKTVIQYKDGKTITKTGDEVTVHNQKGTLLASINLLKKPQMRLYFELTQALFSKKFDTLKKNFMITKQHLKYIFQPKGDTAHIINGIELRLNSDGSVVYFIIDFKNKDNIKIETL